ncbi:MAG: hypothetical protein L6R42_001856 [Xanthoria sp. 1 TBL-2021]|nr:MAG: hypothetical protein L6R42_001856 [Xanthoria sp. 1 TBL-2021]
MTPKDNTGVAEQTMPSPRKMEMEITTDSNPGETTVDIRKGYLKGIPLAVVTISLCLGTFLVALDVNIIGVAVPRIATAFRSLDDVAWYGSGYLLTVTAFQPTMGVIYKDTHNEDRSLSLKEKFQHMDLVGTITFIGSICCLILALQWGGQIMPWSSAKVIALFVTSGVLGIIFGYIQWKLGDRAIIPLRVLRQRSILSGSTFLFVFGMLNYVYSFYLPFYFQAVRGSSATSSGVRMIPLVLPQILSIILVGAIVTKFGVYVPYMIVGQTICVIGAGAITRIDLHTSTALWATYFVIAGLGMGMGMQIPYTALQVVLSERDAPTGNAIAVFSNQLGGVVAIPACQALLLNSLRTEIPQKTTAVTPETVVNTGPTNLQLLAHGNDALLRTLRQTYATGLRRTYIFALAAGCAAVICALGMERRNLIVEAETRERVAENGREQNVNAEVGSGERSEEVSIELRPRSIDRI